MHIKHPYTSLTLDVDYHFLLLRSFKGVNWRSMWCTCTSDRVSYGEYDNDDETHESFNLMKKFDT